MIRRWTLRLFLSGVLFLGITVPVMAGGWAVLTLGEFPGEVMVARPFRVGFTVRQHGHHPVPDLKPRITARHPDSGESLVFEAVPRGPAGHYEAEITLPRAGLWTWSIDAFMDFSMPVLTARAAPGPAAAAGFGSPGQPVFMLIGILGLVVASGSFILLRRQTVRQAMPLLALTIVIGAASLFSVAQLIAVAAPPGAATSPSAELGRVLFTAKGCATCHIHDDVEATFSVGIGPNLTNYKGNPEFLQQWLQDPKAFRPETEMPDLGLSEAEIEALIRFLAQ